MTNEERVNEVTKGHARGWRFTPLDGKTPRLSRWSSRQRADLATSIAYARRGNVGLRTGEASGIAVIDCDNGADIEALNLPKTPTVNTGGGGKHFYFSIPKGTSICNSAGRIAPHVDVRGEGGQAVFPGSIHPATKHLYRWADGLSPDDVPLAPFPEHLLSRLKEPPPAQEFAPPAQSLSAYAAAALHEEWEAVRNAPEGERNDTLNRAAFALGTLLPTGEIDRQVASQALFEAAQAAGLSEAEAMATIESGLTAGAKKPRWTTEAECTEVTMPNEDIAQGRAEGPVDGTPERIVEREPIGSGDNSLTSLISPPPSLDNLSRQWPRPLGEDAFYGLAGEIVRIIEPHTEADPAALLFSLLTFFGKAAGANAYFLAEADRHYPRPFVVLVGATAKGRKGTSLSHILRVFRLLGCGAEEESSGLSSGEGLIWAVRDAIEAHGRNKYDPGVSDKRLLVVESEFASVLRVLRRDGNTLSAIIRAAWDKGNLQTLTKNTPARATGAHICIIAHITKDELLRDLDSTEVGNGLANRFLWVCVKRSHLLPEGGNLQDSDFAGVLPRLHGALTYVAKERELRRDDTARALWHEVYPVLSDGLPGMLGAVTSRAEAQVMRLALIYALLDCAETIRIEHLKAGLACWDYCFASAQCVFGDSLGDPVADEVLHLVRQSPNGLTRTELSDCFGRHQSKSRIGRAISDLEAKGLIQISRQSTGGRPVERIRANGA